MRIAVIPARGGSKRIPRKNIRDFFGKPMISWSIEAAKGSGIFDLIIVSTDDSEIAEIAKNLSANVPFERPASLSGEYSGTTEVVAHATNWALQQGWELSEVCCIYATAPYLCSQDLKLGLELLNSGNWHFAISVTDFASPIFRSFRLEANGGIEMFFPEHFSTRSQDLPVALHDAGQFYWGRPESWIEGRRLFSRHSVPVKVPRWRVQDIDTEEDWIMAERLFGQLKDKHQ
jgi:pseudaminic acid cytidylyltransferase